VIYYRHPGGKFIYSATPRQGGDGRAFIAVHAGEDVTFDSAPALAPDAKSAGTRRILYYRNPMGLPDTSPVPKKDSMGMDYLPVYEGEAAGAGSVVLAAGKVQRSGVRTALAERRVLSRPVRAPAVIRLDERRISVVSTRTEGFIEEVADVTTGERVAKGEKLVQLFSREIATAGADFVTNLRSGGPTEGATQRLKNLGVPLSEIENIKKGGKAPLRIALGAPHGGVVLERNAVSGMMAVPGQTLFRIADMSSVWAIVDIPEFALGAMRLGLPASVRLRSLPGREFRGKIDLIYPEIAPQTRTAKVRVELPNPDGALMANMYAQAEIAAGTSDAVIAVPSSAVIDTGERQIVFIDKGEGRFEPRNVRLGASGDDFIEIRQGLAAGERVVVSANFLIDAESNLKAALSSLAPPEAQP
jgi:Cu(I)/Ag(I) efflux system membrane fusion protein